MQIHKATRKRIHHWNANPSVEKTLRASALTHENGVPNEYLDKRAHRIRKGLAAIGAFNRATADVPERWHALVRFNDREHPIKYVTMTKDDAFHRNKTIHDLGMEWVLKEKP